MEGKEYKVIIRYLAELTKEVMDELIEEKYVMQEWRISIYGKSEEEWGKLGEWIKNNELQCHNIRWLI